MPDVTRDVEARARKIRLLVMDVDGVLTDGRMVLSDGGHELKMFHTHDGVGLALAHRAGLKTAMITGETSPIAKLRGAKLGVETVVLGARRKGEAVEALLTEAGLSAETLAYIGDDLLDVPALERAGLAIAVADAVADVKAIAHVVTAAPGGHGAVRESVELILRAQRSWDAIVGSFVEEHGGHALARPRRPRGRSFEKFRELLHLDDPPRRLAVALAVGVFISCTPFWGLQTVLSIVVAAIFRLNRAATITGTWINLPWFAPFVYGAAIKIGLLVVPSLGEADAASLDVLLKNPGALSWGTVWSWLRGSSLPLLVGSVIVGGIAAAVTYVVAFAALARRRVRRDPATDASSRRVV